MKILCVIDHFGAGGAQRQMVELACGLKLRGHAVEIFVYHPQYDFFKSRVMACGIPVHEYKKGRGFSWGVVKSLSSLTGRFDIVLSYLNSPSIYAEISKLVVRTPKLVVSERSSHLGDKSRTGASVRRALHRLADRVVVNSHSHKQWLENNFPWLQGKVTSIYNGLNVESYAQPPNVPTEKEDLRLLVIGRVGPEKNAINLVAGCGLYYQMYRSVPRIAWVGRRDNSLEGQRYCRKLDGILDSFPEVKKQWRWFGERNDVPDLLGAHHALIHPSLYEGLPNVVCEALASGRPVLISDVCDHSLLVADGKRGFLFDPYSPESIAKSIRRLVTLGDEEWLQLSKNARQYAGTFLTVTRMVSAYEALFSGLVRKVQ